MTLRFSKYEGLGNDFLVVEGSPPGGGAAKAVARLCDRHFGVGGDGVLWTGLAAGRPFMKVLNADGSAPEMCGNGLRCVALYLVHRQRVDGTEFVVDTDAGPHRVRVPEVARSAQVQVELPPASLDASRVLRAGSGPFLEQPFDVEGRTLHLSCVSMGNPHVVLFEDVGQEAAALGPRVARDPRFLAGANVSFARVESDKVIQLVVWERGVGFTLACGTAACAAAVAAVETGRSPRGENIDVRLPGGSLTIKVGRRGDPLVMVGPARHVFDGEIEVEDER